MKKITDTYQSSEPVTKTIDMFQTTDGRKWSLHEEEKAEKHQLMLDRIAEFKKKINYTILPFSYGQHDSNMELDCAFSFEISDDMAGTEEIKLLDKIQDMTKDQNLHVEYLLPNKYVCIQYSKVEENPNGRDWYSYSGFFGTVDEYITRAEKHIQELQTELREIGSYFR